jgi:hypothetical protein
MKPEVGKTYVSRSGQRWVVTSVTHDPWAPVRAHMVGNQAFGCGFQPDGRVFSYQNDPFDLIEESRP